MSGTPLVIGSDQLAALTKLRETAATTPVNMIGLLERLKRPEGKKAHMAQMTAQTVEIPFGYAVTFSIETGHPAGTARHMSMSSSAAGRVPVPEALWIIAKVLGFTGCIEDCVVWIEDLQGHGQAVNVVQPFTASAAIEGRA